MIPFREGPPTIVYGGDDEYGGAEFDRTCPTCGRFVRPDAEMRFRGAVPIEPNADCSRCGRLRRANRRAT